MLPFTLDAGYYASAFLVWNNLGAVDCGCGDLNILLEHDVMSIILFI